MAIIDLPVPVGASITIVACGSSKYALQIAVIVSRCMGLNEKSDPSLPSFIIWSNIQKCEIYLLPKITPILDHFLTIDDNKDNYHQLLKNNYLWNNYFIWKDKEPSVILYKHFDKMNNKTYVENYIDLIIRAVNESIENTTYFLNNI